MALTDQQKLFIDALLSEEIKGDIPKAKAAAGYPMNLPQSKLFASKEFVEEVLKAAGQYLVTQTPGAVFALLDVMHSPNKPGAPTKKGAAEAVLDRTGIAKRESLHVEHSIPNSIIRIPSKVMLEERAQEDVITVNGDKTP